MTFDQLTFDQMMLHPFLTETNSYYLFHFNSLLFHYYDTNSLNLDAISLIGARGLRAFDLRIVRLEVYHCTQPRHNPIKHTSLPHLSSVLGVYEPLILEL